MKLKFVLVPLMVLGFAVASYADCTKDEIMKLIDKGYSKTEINGICGKSEPKKEESKWISPSKLVCVSNGGSKKNGVCSAPWLEAKNICSASGGSLASIHKLKKVVIDCGGTLGKWEMNQRNTSYQSCYKNIGFNSYPTRGNTYWSKNSKDSLYALSVTFLNGVSHKYEKRGTNNVVCISEK